MLVNSNPATIMTDPGVADRTYIEPLTAEFLELVIARERPDALLAGLGGQTGLNLAVELADRGILERYDVEILGTPIESIRTAEDRELFKNLLERIGEPVADSVVARTVEEAEAFAEQIGLPLIIRPAFTLGGTGGGTRVHARAAAHHHRQSASPPARSARCWSSARCSAGKRSSTR